MAKVRVYELAKQLGLESKELLAKLNEMGEFVRSASSTIEAPVVRKVKEKIAQSEQEGEKPASEKKTTAAKKTQKSKAGSESASATKKTTGEKTKTAGRKVTPKTSANAPRPSQAGTPKSVPTPKAAAASAAKAKADAKPTPKSAQSAAAHAKSKSAIPKTATPKAAASKSPASKSGASTSAAPKPAAPKAAGAKSATPKSVAPKPAPPKGSPKKQSAPRPGNNPYTSSQGMGQRKARPQGNQQGQQRRAGGAATMPRPGATGGLPSGMPRPNPAMMPKHSKANVPKPGTKPNRERGGNRSSRRGGGQSNYRTAGRSTAPAGQASGGPGRPGGNRPPRGRGGRGSTQGAFGRGGGRKNKKSRKQRRQEYEEMQAPVIGGVRIKKGNGQKIRLRRGSSLADLAEKIDVDAAQLVKILFNMGEMITATQSVPDETLEILGAELDYDIEVVSPEDEDRELLESFDLEFGEDEGDESDLVVRPPVVTVMGHVDHGKTKLLDALRHSNVQGEEAGGITQSIGAYQVQTEVDGQERKITFIDTPGHEAFTQMRARGAKSTDIAVLVVAADDGVMPQTVEALNHARAADVPIVVAVNKIDKPEADPSKVRGQLMEFGLTPEEYGGDTMFVDVSAVTGQGLDDLLEAIILTADAELDLRANPNMDAQGVAIEAHLDQGRGPMATVLIQRGTLHKGESIIAGSSYGRVRAMINDRGETIEEAPPSTPVQVLGLTSVPRAGDNFLVVDDDRTARQIAEQRESRMRAAQQAKTGRRKTLEELFEQMEKGETSELTLILKGDGAGSVEALEDSLSKIEVSDEVSLRVIDRGVGAITETNVTLASASEPHAVIIGFNVRPTVQAQKLADQEGVDIRYYTVIYDAIDDIEKALKGMLKPIYEEKTIGQAEIRQIFRSSKFGNIAGSMVLDGVIRRGAKARLVRDGVVVQETGINSLRREKDDVNEVREGFECGITLVDFNDIAVGDIIECYEMVEKPRE